MAALEALLVPQFPEWTEEQVTEFRRKWEEHAKEPPRLLPPAPLLTPELARALLRECVTVVKPGETLVIRAPDSWTPEELRTYQEYADAATEAGVAPFGVLVVLGEELGVAEAR